MKRVRDNQRSKVYKAEKILFIQEQMTLQECSKLAKRAAKKSVIIPISVSDGRGRRSPCAIPRWNQIRLPKWSRQPVIVLHEVAHLQIPRNVAWHGREFAKCYLNLVRRYMGKESGDRLRDSFKQNRVKYIVRETI